MTEQKPTKTKGRPKGPQRGDLCISAPISTVEAFKQNALRKKLSQGAYLTALVFYPSMVHGAMVNPANGEGNLGEE